MYCRTTLFIFYSFILCIPYKECTHMMQESGNYCSRSVTGCNSDPFEKRYLLYDVNPPEGFNLRRDVFMRIAVLTKKLTEFGDWNLVLPPWDALYHWKSPDAGKQWSLPWRMFFDLESIRKFVPVVEFEDFIKDNQNKILDEVYFLQHYKDTWENKDWEDKMGIEPCFGKLPYRLNAERTYEGEFWGHGDMITAKRVRCLSFQGPASFIIPLLIGRKRFGRKGSWLTEPGHTAPRTVMLDRAEVALHDAFGNAEYWQARRSMRFATSLVAEAAAFRKQALNSTDEQDSTVRPADWTEEKSHAIDNPINRGGPYLCVHLRRQDFVWGRSSEVPSLKWAAQQVTDQLNLLKLFTVFVATDAPSKEVNEFRKHIGTNYNVVQWKPSKKSKMIYKDGGVAIIDQIICSHARFFIGTHESTFSFRIQEEREIMGFHPDSTFNRLCGGDGPPSPETNEKSVQVHCEQPSRWRIVF